MYRFLWCVLLVILSVMTARAADFIASCEVHGAHGLQGGNHSYPCSPYSFHVIIDDTSAVTFGLSSPHGENSIGAFELQIRSLDDDSKVHLDQKATEPFPLKRSNAFIASAAKSIQSLPDNFKAYIYGHGAIMTSVFVSELEEYAARQPGLYNVVPQNSSFGVKFRMNISESEMSWFIKRRPPIPQFTAEILDAEGSVLKAAQSKTPDPHGVLYSNIVDMKGAREDSRLKKITLKVTFYEPQREFHSHFHVSNFAEKWKALQEGEYNGKLDIHGDDVNGLYCRLEYADKGSTLVFIQPFPMQDVLMYVRDGETKHLVFAEAERNIPVISKEDSRQFGWRNAFPSKSTPSSLDIDIYYGEMHHAKGRAKEELSILELARWVKDYGGHVDGFKPFHHRNSIYGLKANHDYRSGQTLAVIPFQTLLLHTTAESIDTIQAFLGTQVWRNIEENNGTARDHYMAFIMMTLLKPNAPEEGTNWRVMYDTFVPEIPHHLPSFFSEKQQTHLFPSGTVMENALQAEAEIIAKEYGALCDAFKEFRGMINEEQFKAARAHVLYSMFNVSHEYLLCPFYNLMFHDEDPNIHLNIDYQRRVVYFIAARNIKKDSLLRISRGARAHTKPDYYIQYGVVPIASPDVALVNQVPLTTDKFTRQPLLRKLAEAEADDSDSVLDLEDQNLLKELMSTLQAKLKDLPEKITETSGDHKRDIKFANRLLEGERKVLETHLLYLEDDVSDL